ncbi:YbaB/EbfC family nucleoid-associated protein [Eisenibacter elegans]|jgi:DNA-binding YbaB/EbfC family protein|uniref:YbaB/EbfC family nucleoid-associated protein n=1 Tax=Eisenibacter elegans TaxID=997 RepID=UPI0003F77505|nr:YbaB/EbfC family nucleoid-associated protein [Eisenibacter elegans]
MFDFKNIMGKVKELQEKVEAARAELVNITAEAEAGAGMVKAVVNGKKQVVGLEIDESLLKPEEKEMLRDLTIAAINKAIEAVEEKAQEAMQQATSGLIDPNMMPPGFDFGGLK